MKQLVFASACKDVAVFDLMQSLKWNNQSVLELARMHWFWVMQSLNKTVSFLLVLARMQYGLMNAFPKWNNWVFASACKDAMEFSECILWMKQSVCPACNKDVMGFDKCNLHTRKSLGDFQFYESQVLPFDDFLWWARVTDATIWHLKRENSL
jgi:hypothetical protein